MSTASSGNLFLITPSDDDDLTLITRAISIAAEGTLRIIDESGNDVTIPSGALATGISHPIRATKVMATGTSATGILGWA